MQCHKQVVIAVDLMDVRVQSDVDLPDQSDVTLRDAWKLSAFKRPRQKHRGGYVYQLQQSSLTHVNDDV